MLLFFASIVNAEQVSHEQYEKSFEEGLSLVDTNPSQASEIFKKLYEDTKSTRVKLEWARSLYADKKFDAAKQVFREILSEELPLPVRDRVEMFLSDIDVNVNPLTLSFGLVRDTNPRASPNEQQISLFGQTFNFSPEIKPKSEFGILATLSYISPQSINHIAGLSAQINNYDYPTKQNDRTIAKVTVFRRLDTIINLGIGGSYEENLLGYKTLFHSPSVFVDYFIEPTDSTLIGINYKKSFITFPQYDYLDATQNTYSLVATKDFSPYLKMFIEGAHENNKTDYEAYTYRGNNAGLGFKWGSRNGGIQITGKASGGKRNYGLDPFFGELRSDSRRSESVSVTKRDLYVFGFRPSLELFWETNKSTIPINSYQKDLASIMFTKVF